MAKKTTTSNGTISSAKSSDAVSTNGSALLARLRDEAEAALTSLEDEKTMLEGDIAATSARLEKVNAEIKEIRLITDAGKPKERKPRQPRKPKGGSEAGAAASDTAETTEVAETEFQQEEAAAN